MASLLHILALALLLLLSASSAAAEDSRPVKLGFIAPLTGDAATYGNDEHRAVELALEDAVKDGLIKQGEVEVIYEDGKCSGKDAAAAASKLLNIDQVAAIIGGSCSGETLGAAPLAEKAQKILISSYSSSPLVTTAGDFVFRAAPSDIEGAGVLAGEMKRNGLKSTAIISENTVYATELRKAFLAALPDLKVTFDEFFNPDDHDFRALLLKAKQSKAEALVLNPQSAIKSGLLVKQLRQLGWTPTLYGGFSFSAPETAEAAGGITALEGMKFVDVPSVKKPKAKAYIAEFAKRWGTPQSDFDTVLKYDTVTLLIKAGLATNWDGPKMRDYLYQLPNYSGLEYDFHFDKNGDVIGVNWIIKVVKNGAIVEQ